MPDDRSMTIQASRFRAIGINTPSLPWHLSPHNHPFHEIIVPRTGMQTLLLGGIKTQVNTGNIIFCHKGTTHEEWVDAGQPFESLFVSFDWPQCPADIPAVQPDRLHRVTLMMEWLFAEQRSHTRTTPMVCQSLLEAILGQILRLWLHPDDDMVEKVRAYIRENMTLSIRLDDLARVAGLSKYHFIRRYSDLTGRSPMEDVRSLRIERARELIMTTNAPLKNIAEATGIANVYHLSHLFRQRVGTPPGALRSRTWKSACTRAAGTEKTGIKTPPGDVS